MKLSLRRPPIVIAVVANVALFVACATNDDHTAPIDLDDGATPPAVIPDAPSSDAGDAETGDHDAAALRCSGDTCLVDLPNAAIYGLTKWIFAGVHVDAVTGAWAIANGVAGTDDAATAHVLHFEDDAWKVRLAVTLGPTARSVKLTSISGGGAGKIIAVGTAVDDGSGVVLRGDGTSFAIESLGADLRATWVAAPDDAWVVGGDGGVYHSVTDGGWSYEGKTPADFNAVWGTGAGDVYVGGSSKGSFQDNGYLGHRGTDAGAPVWTYDAFPSPSQPVGTPKITGGVASAPGSSFWAGPEFFGNQTVLARTSIDGGTAWTRDPFTAHVSLKAFWSPGPSDVWAVGGLGRLYHFDGTTWKDAFLVFNGAPLTAPLTGIAGSSTELFIVGEGVALRRKIP